MGSLRQVGLQNLERSRPDAGSSYPRIDAVGLAAEGRWVSLIAGTESSSQSRSISVNNLHGNHNWQVQGVMSLMIQAWRTRLGGNG